MPNAPHDHRKQDDRGIDADVVDTFVTEVGDTGYAEINSNHTHHRVAWSPIDLGGGVRTASYNGRKKEHVQSFVQKDGNVNIGSEEWADERIIVLILDETIEK